MKERKKTVARNGVTWEFEANLGYIQYSKVLRDPVLNKVAVIFGDLKLCTNMTYT